MGTLKSTRSEEMVTTGWLQKRAAAMAQVMSIICSTKPPNMVLWLLVMPGSTTSVRVTVSARLRSLASVTLAHPS